MWFIVGAVIGSISNVSTHLKRLDEVITTEFIALIIGGINCLNNKRKLISLQAKSGGLEIPLFFGVADREYQFSQMLSNDLGIKIINKDRQHQPNDKQNKKIN